MDAASFSERLMGEMSGAMGILLLHIGTKLSLFANLEAANEPVTSEQLAERAGLQERYVREWLSACAAHGYLLYQAPPADAPTPATATPGQPLGTFTLPPGHAEVLLNQDSQRYFTVSAFLPVFGRVLPDLLAAFKQGGGVPFEAYGDECATLIGEGNRPTFYANLGSKWIPCMPDIHEALQEGGIVADIGCGQGYSSVAVARAYPKVRVFAVDADAGSHAALCTLVEREGLVGRIQPVQGLAHTAVAAVPELQSACDLVLLLKCLHDMHNPVEVLASVRALAKPGTGAVLIADEKVEERLEDMLPDAGTVPGSFSESPQNFLGRLNYSYSVLHCLPVAMVFDNSAATGTCMPLSLVRSYATAAGWGGVEVVTETPKWRFYRLTW